MLIELNFINNYCKYNDHIRVFNTVCPTYKQYNYLILIKLIYLLCFVIDYLLILNFLNLPYLNLYSNLKIFYLNHLIYLYLIQNHFLICFHQNFHLILFSIYHLYLVLHIFLLYFQMILFNLVLIIFDYLYLLVQYAIHFLNL